MRWDRLGQGLIWFLSGVLVMLWVDLAILSASPQDLFLRAQLEEQHRFQDQVLSLQRRFEQRTQTMESLVHTETALMQQLEDHIAQLTSALWHDLALREPDAQFREHLFQRLSALEEAKTK